MRVANSVCPRRVGGVGAGSINGSCAAGLRSQIRQGRISGRTHTSETKKVGKRKSPTFDNTPPPDILVYAIGTNYADQQASQGGEVCLIWEGSASRLWEPGDSARVTCQDSLSLFVHRFLSVSFSLRSLFDDAQVRCPGHPRCGRFHFV